MKIGNFSAKTYLDFNATTPLSAALVQEMPEILKIWGNPSSIHWAGQATKTVLREARQKVAQFLGISPLEIVFTSGGSESNSTVLQSYFEKTRGCERNEFITSNIEHPSVAKTLAHLKSLGAVVHVVSVDREGHMDWEHFNRVLSEKTALVSMMLANNETGLLFPIREIVGKAHAVGAKVHTDAVQALGKIPLNLQELGVDYASFSAHKFYALKGIGLLYVKKGNELRPLIFGSQERARRGGTENTLGIWSLGFVAAESADLETRILKLKTLRDHLESRILSEIPEVTITHGQAPRLPNTSSMVIPGVDGETLLMSLDVKGYAVSTGSACSSGSPEPSPVLMGIGLRREEAQSSLRVSVGWTTTPDEVNQFVETLKSVVGRVRSLKAAPKEALV